MSVVIAHRLSTVKHADEILVIEKGRITERGDHDHLIKHQGTYHHLFELQSQRL
jgi:ABC-type transport system involved in Fe-S cluster assembly fused permease/ATPase subunit